MTLFRRHFGVASLGVERHAVSREGGLDGFDRFWPVLDVILVVSVGLERHAVSREGGLDGFDRFWTLLGVILVGSVGLERHAVSREVGLDGFRRFWTQFFDRVGRFGLQSERLAIDIQ